MSLLDLTKRFQAKASENPFIKKLQSGFQQAQLASIASGREGLRPKANRLYGAQRKIMDVPVLGSLASQPRSRGIRSANLMASGSKQMRQPGALNKGLGALQLTFGGSLLTPTAGFRLSTAEPGLTSLLESARKSGRDEKPFGGLSNLATKLRKNMQDPYAGVGTTGLGLEGNVGLAADFLLDPDITPALANKIGTTFTKAMTKAQYKNLSKHIQTLIRKRSALAKQGGGKTAIKQLDRAIKSAENTLHSRRIAGGGVLGLTDQKLTGGDVNKIQQDVADMRARGVPDEEIKAAVKAYGEPAYKPVDPNAGKGFLLDEPSGQRVWNHIKEPIWDPKRRWETGVPPIGEKIDHKATLGQIDIAEELGTRTNLKSFGFTDAEIDSGKSLTDIYIKENPQARPKTAIKFKQPEPVIKTTKKTSLLTKEEFAAIPTREGQLGYIKNLQANMRNFNNALGTKLNAEGAKVRGAIKGTRNTRTYQKLMDRYASFIEGVDSSWKKRQDYRSEMIAGMGDIDAFGDVNKGLWISADDVDMGNINNQRIGNILNESLEQDWKVIANRYGDQILTKLYLNNLHGKDLITDAALKYTREVNESLAKKTGIAKEIKIPDFVQEGNKNGVIDQVTDYDLTSVGALSRENNNVFKKIGGPLYEKWGNLRDVTTQLIDTSKLEGKELSIAIKENGEKYKFALQEFVEQVGKTDIKDGALRKYVNLETAKMISKRQLERNTGAIAADTMNGVFSRAHLWLSATTGMKQLLEVTRLPAYYWKNPKELVRGVKKTLNPQEVRRASVEYNLKDFDDPFDLKQIRKELTDAFVKDGMNTKQATAAAADMVDKVGFSLLTGGERFKNTTYALVAEEIGRAKNLEGADLVKFVREALFEQGNVASKFNKAQMFDNSLTRLALQYSQYPIKNTRQFMDALQNKETGKAIGLMGSQMFNIAAIMGITGLAGKYAIQGLLPLSPGPVFSVTGNIFDTMTNDTMSEASKKDKMLRIAQQNFQPGGAQTVRTREGLKAGKGYDTASAGGVRYYGEEASLPTRIKGAVFGKNALPDVRKYYDEKRTVFGENQSAIFKATGDKDIYAAGVLSDRETNKMIKSTKESLEKGDEVKDVQSGSFSIDGTDYEGYVIGDRFIYRDENGESKTKSIRLIERAIIKDEKALTNSQYSLTSDRLKRSDDIESWIGLTESYVDYLKDYKTKLDSKKDAKEKIDVQNKIEDLEASLEKYLGYGGFTKPKAGSKYSSGKKITVSAPRTKAFKFGKAPKLNLKSVSQPPAMKISGAKTAVKLPRVEAYSPETDIKSKVRWL